QLLRSQGVRRASPSRPVPAPFLLAAATVLLIGLAMRAPFIAVSPILTEIQAAYRLSNVSASLLTTLPVLCFGILALLTPGLARRFGTDRTMLAALVLVAAGVLIRSFLSAGGLFTGTLVLRAAKAVANVLLPGLIK